jgi:hypothetical protein
MVREEMPRDEPSGSTVWESCFKVPSIERELVNQESLEPIVVVDEERDV